MAKATGVRPKGFFNEDEVSSLPEKEKRTLKRNGVLLDVMFLSLLLIGIGIELVQNFSN